MLMLKKAMHCSTIYACFHLSLYLFYVYSAEQEMVVIRFGFNPDPIAALFLCLRKRYYVVQ